MTITFCKFTVLPPHIFTGMYESFSIVFYNSAGLDVLRKETTTFFLGQIIRTVELLCVTTRPHLREEL